MSNHRHINTTNLTKDRSFEIVEKIYHRPNEISDVELIALNRRLRYGRQPIPGVSSGRFRKLTFK